MTGQHPHPVAAQLVAGVVRELRFVERALLADEPALASRHLSTADDLLRAARREVEPPTEPTSLHWQSRRSVA